MEGACSEILEDALAEQVDVELKGGKQAAQQGLARWPRQCAGGASR